MGWTKTVHGEGACGGLWVIHGAAKAQGEMVAE